MYYVKILHYAMTGLPRVLFLCESVSLDFTNKHFLLQTALSVYDEDDLSDVNAETIPSPNLNPNPDLNPCLSSTVNLSR